MNDEVKEMTNELDKFMKNKEATSEKTEALV